MYSYGPSHMDKLKQDDQLEHTYSSYVRIRDVAQETCQRRWTIGKSGERGSGISMLAARHEIDIYIHTHRGFYDRLQKLISDTLSTFWEYKKYWRTPVECWNGYFGLCQIYCWKSLVKSVGNWFHQKSLKTKIRNYIPCFIWTFTA